MPRQLYTQLSVMPILLLSGKFFINKCLTGILRKCSMNNPWKSKNYFLILWLLRFHVCLFIRKLWNFCDEQLSFYIRINVLTIVGTSGQEIMEGWCRCTDVLWVWALLMRQISFNTSCQTVTWCISYTLTCTYIIAESRADNHVLWCCILCISCSLLFEMFI